MTDVTTGAAEGQIDAELWQEMLIENREAETAKPVPVEAPEPAEVTPAVDEVSTWDMGEEPVDVAETPAEDLWASAPEPLRAAYEAERAEKARLEQRLRSDDGRVAAYQRKVEELRKAAEAPTAAEETSANARLASMAEDYPEIAGPLQEALAVLEGRLNHQDAVEKSRREAAQSELLSIVEDETRRLEEKHPDWHDTLSKNGPAFAAWVQDQPRRIRDAATRNSAEIVDASEAIEIVQNFKQHLAGPAEVPAAAAVRPLTPPNPPLNDRRTRQLDGIASPPRTARRAALSVIPEEGDPQTIWNMIRDAEQR